MSGEGYTCFALWSPYDGIDGIRTVSSKIHSLAPRYAAIGWIGGAIVAYVVVREESMDVLKLYFHQAVIVESADWGYVIQKVWNCPEFLEVGRLPRQARSDAQLSDAGAWVAEQRARTPTPARRRGWFCG